MFKVPPTRTPEEAEKAGYDCGMHGARGENCHFKYFATVELKEAWERGYREAKAAKQKGATP